MQYVSLSLKSRLSSLIHKDHTVKHMHTQRKKTKKQNKYDIFSMQMIPV